MLNIYAAWIGFLLGCLAGITSGLFFHREQWLGSYTSWPRRLTRLAHISFFGIGLLNLSFALTCRTLKIESGVAVSSVLLVVAAITMPLICYLSAWKMFFRNIFFIPALSATSAIALFVWRLMS